MPPPQGAPGGLLKVLPPPFLLALYTPSLNPSLADLSPSLGPGCLLTPSFQTSNTREMLTQVKIIRFRNVIVKLMSRLSNIVLGSSYYISVFDGKIEIRKCDIVQ